MSGGRNTQGRIRIIAGAWRGRMLPVADLPGLRPTTDRIRETVFNWLQAEVPDARCLDLFAGTGSLGLEALSRGAKHCDFVEQLAPAQKMLNEALRTLKASDRGTIHNSEAIRFLTTAVEPYDLVFLDPPFDGDLLGSACETLNDSKLLRQDSLIYIEQSAKDALAIPENWVERRSKRTGGVFYGLYQFVYHRRPPTSRISP